MSRLLTDEEVKAKLGGYKKALSQCHIGSKERKRIRDRIYDLNHYAERRAKARERDRLKRAEKQMNKKLTLDELAIEKSTVLLSRLQLDLWDSKKTSDIKLNTDFAKKYWG